jgi:hypothetical protein
MENSGVLGPTYTLMVKYNYGIKYHANVAD